LTDIFFSQFQLIVDHGLREVLVVVLEEEAWVAVERAVLVVLGHQLVNKHITFLLLYMIVLLN
jgi:hypothetical protein